MTNEEILKKAIEKAAKANWQYASYWYGIFEDKKWDLKPFEIRGVFLSIDFAKAFWGEENLFSYSIPYGEYAGDTEIMQEYEYHLQQMVLEENPLKYLEKFVTAESKEER